jgi:hypothetical protein
MSHERSEVRVYWAALITIAFYAAHLVSLFRILRYQGRDRFCSQHNLVPEDQNRLLWLFFPWVLASLQLGPLPLLWPAIHLHRGAPDPLNGSIPGFDVYHHIDLT